MAIVYQKDKRSGITYAYESKSYWDKEKQQSRAKRHLIGRLNEETGKIEMTHTAAQKSGYGDGAQDVDMLALIDNPQQETIPVQVEDAGLEGLVSQSSLDQPSTEWLDAAEQNAEQQIDDSRKLARELTALLRSTSKFTANSAMLEDKILKADNLLDQIKAKLASAKY